MTLAAPSYNSGSSGEEPFRVHRRLWTTLTMLMCSVLTKNVIYLRHGVSLSGSLAHSRSRALTHSRSHALALSRSRSLCSAWTSGARKLAKNSGTQSKNDRLKPRSFYLETRVMMRVPWRRQIAKVSTRDRIKGRGKGGVIEINDIILNH